MRVDSIGLRWAPSSFFYVFFLIYFYFHIDLVMDYTHSTNNFTNIRDILNVASYFAVKCT